MDEACSYILVLYWRRENGLLLENVATGVDRNFGGGLRRERRRADRQVWRGKEEGRGDLGGRLGRRVERRAGLGAEVERLLVAGVRGGLGLLGEGGRRLVGVAARLQQPARESAERLVEGEIHGGHGGHRRGDRSVT